MAAPGFPTKTFYPWLGWYYYRSGTTAALKKSRAHFFVSWGTFDPISGSYPGPIVTGAQIFLDMTMQV